MQLVPARVADRECGTALTLRAHDAALIALIFRFVEASYNFRDGFEGAPRAECGVALVGHRRDLPDLIQRFAFTGRGFRRGWSTERGGEPLDEIARSDHVPCAVAHAAVRLDVLDDPRNRHVAEWWRLAH